MLNKLICMIVGHEAVFTVTQESYGHAISTGKCHIRCRKCDFDGLVDTPRNFMELVAAASALKNQRDFEIRSPLMDMKQIEEIMRYKNQEEYMRSKS